jgi:hypothetical protein
MKIKEKMIYVFQNTRQRRTDRNVVKSISPNCPVVDSSSVAPYARLTAERFFILLLPFSMFALVAAL